MKQAEYYVNQKQYQDYILNFIDKNVTKDLLTKLGCNDANDTLVHEFKKGFIQGMMFASMLTCKVKTACIELPEEKKSTSISNIDYDNCVVHNKNNLVLAEEIKTSN